MMKQKAVIVTLTALLLVVASYVFKRSKPTEPVLTTSVPTEHSITLRSPAPRIPRSALPAESLADDLQFTNLYNRFWKHGSPQLTYEQAERYVDQNHRSAGSLLAAFRTSANRAFLKEAMEKYPNDPHVSLIALSQSQSPEERRHWLDTFKRDDPANALANLLSAGDHFKAGQTDQAAQELSTADGKAGIQDYWLAFAQDAEEAYRAAGYSDAEAKVAAVSMRLPDGFLDLMQLSQSVIGLANAYRQAGDETSAQAALQLGLNLGRQLDQPAGPCTLPQYVIGLRIESQILGAMDLNSPYGSGGQTVKDQLDYIAEQRAALGNLLRQQDGLLQMLSEQDWMSYCDRIKVVGGLQALQWLVNKYGQQP
jgi:hypothetical protein